ncbi:unnamed protein product [Mytilus coruscus]|uniref:Uncharacterized protein n=1 Tax=Mytilus coruscus TaxID=42192 RepID=A0A6J8ETQ9_MYTCO|nr:unnamed protein product [Mytilus coruscus]
MNRKQKVKLQWQIKGQEIQQEKAQCKNIYKRKQRKSRQDYYEADIDNIDFFKKEKKKRGDKRDVESVLDKNGKSCTSKSEVIKVVTDFYSDLYQSQNTDGQSMTDYLEDLELDKLTEEDKTNFDTFIAQDECLKLLKEFKNNKSPGDKPKMHKLNESVNCLNTNKDVCCINNSPSITGHGWRNGYYPNPARDWTLCGRYEKSLVCDPNGLLSTKEADTLDWLLKGVVNDTKCPCSAWKCESKKSGYVVAVALVRKLNIPKTGPAPVDDNEKLAALRQFAFDLENNKWRFGECNEDVIIAYSAEEGAVFTFAGGTANRRLNQDLIDSITAHRKHYFRGNKHVYAGLRSMVMDYREALTEGGFVFSQQVDQSPKGTGAHVLSTVTSILSLVICTFLLQ